MQLKHRYKDIQKWCVKPFIFPTFNGTKFCSSVLADALANPIPYVKEKEREEEDRMKRQKALTILLDDKDRLQNGMPVQVRPVGYGVCAIRL